MSRTMKALLGVWIVALATAAGWIGWDAMHGGRPSIGGPFSLVDQDGRTVTSDSLKGKPTLIYFGFTYCPDVCPTSLLLMETAIEKLGPDAAKKVNLVFITVDPERDTPAVLSQYMAAFHPGFLGLYGDAEATTRTAKEFKVFFQKQPLPDGGYSVDHSAGTYIYDTAGRLRLFAGYGQGAPKMLHDILLLLQ